MKKLLLFIVTTIMCFPLLACTNNVENNSFRLSNAFSYESKFTYFNIEYDVISYSFMLNYVYNGDHAYGSRNNDTYGFHITDANGDATGGCTTLINGVERSSTYQPLLIKGSTITALFGIDCSEIYIADNSKSYEDFNVELRVGSKDDYTVLASQHFTLEQIKDFCTT